MHITAPSASLPIQQAILRAVPAGARHILHVGCGDGRVGSALRSQVAGRQVFGIATTDAGAAVAGKVLDRVFVLDVEKEDVPLEAGSLDYIVYEEVLARLDDPEAVLRRHRPLLAPGGQVLCSLANVQHHAMLAAILSGDWPCTGVGNLGFPGERFFSYATGFKLLLDAGFVPEIVERVSAPAPPQLLQAAEPLLKVLGLHLGRTASYLNTQSYLFRGVPLPDPDGEEEPITFVVCVSNDAIFQANLLASPCLGPGSPHELIVHRLCRSAAEGLNVGLAQARHRLVVCLHQDVYLPRGWIRRFLVQWRKAETLFGKVGVAGVYGVAGAAAQAKRLGRVVDRDRLLSEPPELPARVDTLDELLLALPRGSPLRFDPQLGFHFYGADIALQATGRCEAAVVLDALCLHNSRSVTLPPEYAESGTRFAQNWPAKLPIATSCVQVDTKGHMCQW